MRSTIELPPLRDHFKQEPLPPFQSSRPRELLPSILSHSPPGRSSTLPPLQRNNSSKIQRPRKSSITQNVRKPKHERTRSKDFPRRPSLSDRKALSAEPQTAAWVQGKRWEDLIEAATSATEVDEDRDTTPVCSLLQAYLLTLHYFLSFRFLAFIVCSLFGILANKIGATFTIGFNPSQQFRINFIGSQESQFITPVITVIDACASPSLVSGLILCRVAATEIPHTTTIRDASQPRQRFGALPID